MLTELQYGVSESVHLSVKVSDWQLVPQALEE